MVIWRQVLVLKNQSLCSGSCMFLVRAADRGFAWMATVSSAAREPFIRSWTGWFGVVLVVLEWLLLVLGCLGRSEDLDHK